ncbi:diaminopimelate decarboxylase family protein [Hymenobacter perfusus]|uniref:Diaminopimelate decarboxylase n=1 Tax=Hymenobacter perfusus TaxID=1236770 RepID=A0A3R9NW40_9BACT|nr:diaminopimelate decarboxylase [Hymenobacter perfusus]RSK38914.1 diaminopimelate decarboxylase [Hymenobacter perfusus]
MIETATRLGSVDTIPENQLISDAMLATLASQHGTPLYVYNLARLRSRLLEIQHAFAKSDVSLFFATMANDRLPVLQMLAAYGVGACVNSIPHLRMAGEAGFSNCKIQFTSTGITENDMRVLQHAGIRTNLDSLSQLKAWFELGAPEGGLRINASSLGAGLEKNRIGVPASSVQEALAMAATLGRSLAGLHIYLGTNFQRPEPMLPTLSAFFELAASIPSLRYINIGGGIGVNYQHEGAEFDIHFFGRSIEFLVNQLQTSLGRHIDVVFEPGRGLAAGCGTFVTSVTDVKDLDGEQIAVVDGSVAIFPRPFHHPETPHRIRHIGTKECLTEKETPTKTLVVGRTTFSRDILGSALLNYDLKVGELLAFDNAGAYSQSMASRFLGQAEPHVEYVNR